MLRARVAVGACVAALAAGGAVLADGDSSPAEPEDRPCADFDSSFSTETLHDVRSLADAMAIVRGVREWTPPEP
ncbi:MAG TPA: hypothetical protein VJT68_04030, partial [Thermoleophilaceae bacterium]|nr:hypothetical protein [Thermoleophilaceae bacterium]